MGLRIDLRIRMAFLSRLTHSDAVSGCPAEQGNNNLKLFKNLSARQSSPHAQTYFPMRFQIIRQNCNRLVCRIQVNSRLCIVCSAVLSESVFTTVTEISHV